MSKRNTENSKIAVQSETFLGQRKNSIAIQGVTPIAGSSSVVTMFQPIARISLKEHVDGVGSIVIKLFTEGKSIGLGSSSGADLEIEGLDQIDHTHQRLTIGDATTNGIASTSPISLTAPTIFRSGSEALNFTGNLTSTKDLTFDVAGNSSVGVLNLGAGSLSKEGAGVLNLTAANSYSGATNINAGTLQLSNTGALGGTSALNLDGGTLRFSSAASIPSGVPVVLKSGGGGFEVDAGLSPKISQSISGSGALTKTGSGTLTLSGANSYSGSTAVNGGTLTVTGSAPLTATCASGASSNVCPSPAPSPSRAGTKSSACTSSCPSAESCSSARTSSCSSAGTSSPPVPAPLPSHRQYNPAPASGSVQSLPADVSGFTAADVSRRRLSNQANSHHSRSPL